MRRVRPKLIYALLAAAVLGVIVMPVAFAGAASGPQATASASVKKQVKKLKQQVNQLRQEVEDLSKQPGPQGPGGPQGAEGPPGPATGPAGGDLMGTFPNPLIGPNAVASNEIANDAVTTPKLANGATSTPKLADGAVNSAKLGDGQVGNPDLANDSVTTSNIADGNVVDQDISRDAVGNRALRGLTFDQTTSSIPPQSSKLVQARCPLDEIAITGGGYFTDADDSFVNLWVMGSFPSFLGNAWNARGANPGLTARNFTTVVICLPQ
jgi:hypothetical protein